MASPQAAIARPQDFPSLQALTERLKLHPRGARDYFDLLVSLQFLDRHDGTYSNTPNTDIGGYLELVNARIYPLFMSLGEGLRTGKLQNEAKEQNSDDSFGSMYANPDVARSFLSAMTAMSDPVARAVATKTFLNNHSQALEKPRRPLDILLKLSYSWNERSFQ